MPEKANLGIWRIAQKGVEKVVFSDIFESLCKKAGIAPTRLLIELGIGKSALSNWKRGSVPSNRTAKQIADYFGITVAELMSGQIEKAPAEEAEADGELMELLEDIRSTPGLRTLFSLSRKATEEDVLKTIEILKILRGGGGGDDDR